MKRQFAMLLAMSLMLSGMAAIAEENTESNAEVQTEISEWSAPFEDGDWLIVEEWNAEVYLPAGWLLSDLTEDGFIAADSEGTSSISVTIEAFESEEADVESDEAADEATGEAEEETDLTLSAFENYLIGLGEDYQLSLMGDRQAASFEHEADVTVKFLLNGKLITMTFAPNEEGGIADQALEIAQTFYLYQEISEVDIVEEGELENAELELETTETNAEA